MKGRRNIMATKNSNRSNTLLSGTADADSILKNMTNHTIKDTRGTSTQIYSNGYSPPAVIQNHVQSINRSIFNSGTTRMNETSKVCSDFDSIQDAIDQMVADCRAACSAEAFLKNYCGIILDNDDTGWDAGGLTAKTDDNVIPETAAAAMLDSLTNATYTRNGLKRRLSSRRDYSQL